MDLYADVIGLTRSRDFRWEPYVSAGPVGTRNGLTPVARRSQKEDVAEKITVGRPAGDNRANHLDYSGRRLRSRCFARRPYRLPKFF